MHLSPLSMEPPNYSLYNGPEAFESSLYLPQDGDEETGGYQDQYSVQQIDASNYVGSSGEDGAGSSQEENFSNLGTQTAASNYVGSSGEDRAGTSQEENLETQRAPGFIRAWLAELQSLGDISNEVAALGSNSTVFDSFTSIYSDFREAAKNIGRTIISEMHLPDEHKTIVPVSLGGVAGGQKLVHSGILFKFAADVQLANGSFMYGDDSADLARANKACGHELKSLDAFSNAALELGVSGKIQVPLMALIDYRGSRCVALSFLPISGTTLVLGSNDGSTCVSRDVEAFGVSSLICESLGLASHKVGLVTVPACGDLEVHRGTDDQLYVLDFARLMPPEHPSKGQRAGRAIFYELLRPELVQTCWPCDMLSEGESPRLCSDALSGWGRSDPNWRGHNKNVLEASNFMRNCQTKACADAFDTLIEPSCKYGIIGLKNVVSLFGGVSAMLHRFGVNMRHVSKVRDWSKIPFVRMLLLSAMVARVAKEELRAKLRNLAAALRVSYEAPFQSTVLHYVNTLRGLEDGSFQWWTRDCMKLLESKYGPVKVLPTDMKGSGRSPSEKDLSVRVCLPLLIDELVRKMGYVWATDPLVNLATLNSKDGLMLQQFIYPSCGVMREPQTQIIQPDVLNSMQPIVRMTKIALWVQGRALLQSGLELMEKRMLFRPALELFYSSRRFLESASQSGNSELYVDLAFLLWKTYLTRARLCIDVDNLRDLLREAITAIEEAKKRGCVSTRCLMMQIILGLHVNIQFQNSTQFVDFNRGDVYPASAIRQLVHQCFEGDFDFSIAKFEDILCTGPINAPMTLFIVLLLLYDHRGMDKDFRCRYLVRLASFWLCESIAACDSISRIIQWAGAGNIIGNNGTHEETPPDGCMMSQGEWTVGRILHVILSEALMVPPVKQQLEERILSLRSKNLVFSHLLSLPTRGLYSRSEKALTVRRDSADLITGDDEAYLLARRVLLAGNVFLDRSAMFPLGSVLQYFELIGDAFVTFRPVKATFRSSRQYPTLAVPSFINLKRLSASESVGVDPLGFAKMISEASLSLTHVEIKQFTDKGAMDASSLIELTKLEHLRKLRLVGFNFAPARASTSSADGVLAENVLQTVLASRCKSLESLGLVSCSFPEKFDISAIPFSKDGIDDGSQLQLKAVEFSLSTKIIPVTVQTFLETLVSSSCRKLVVSADLKALDIPVAQLTELTFGDRCSSDLMAFILSGERTFFNLQSLKMEARGIIANFPANLFSGMAKRLPKLEELQIAKTRSFDACLWSDLVCPLLTNLKALTCSGFFFDNVDATLATKEPGSLLAVSLSCVTVVPIPIWQHLCLSPRLHQVSISDCRSKDGNFDHLLVALESCATLKSLTMSRVSLSANADTLLRNILLKCPLLETLDLEALPMVTEDLFTSIGVEDDTIRAHVAKAFCRLKSVRLVAANDLGFKSEHFLTWVRNSFDPSDLALESLTLSNFSPLLWLQIIAFQARFTRIACSSR